MDDGSNSPRVEEPQTDILDELEMSRYEAGRRHGINQTLEHPAFAEISLRLQLALAVVDALTAELARRDRTIRAYQALIRSGT